MNHREALRGPQPGTPQFLFPDFKNHVQGFFTRERSLLASGTMAPKQSAVRVAVPM